MFLSISLVGLASLMLLYPSFFTNHLLHPSDTVDKINRWLDRY